MRDAKARFTEPIGSNAAHDLVARCGLLVLAAVLVMALTFASSARAEIGVIGTDQFKGEPEAYYPVPGALNNGGQDVEVNSTGAGGVEAGDYYSVDGARIQQFSPDGELIRLWGKDVVSSGPGNADETQSVAIFATGGTFTLTFGGETTEPMPYNASPSTVEGELNGLASIGGVGASVEVSGGPGNELGSTPYVVTFGGVQANASQPLLVVDNSALTGPGATSFVASTNPGGTGREICEPSNGDTCQGGGYTGYNRLAINQVNGHVLASNERRVDEFTATGRWLRSFGFDVVKTGPDDSNADEQDTLTVKATGGTFDLKVFSFEGREKTGHEFQETTQIPWNATAEEVEVAIDGIPFIGTSVGGSVKVTGGPGDELGTKPYVITFKGVYAGDGVEEFRADANELIGPGKSATITTTSQGGAAEVCTPSDVCNDPFGGGGGAPGSFRAVDLAVAPEGAPNEGNVLVADGTRIQEFDPTGHFIRLFGWGVVASGPDRTHEPQNIELVSGGGTFKLSFAGQQTGALPYNATAKEVEDALNPLSTIEGAGGSVAVTGGPGGYPPNPYEVVFGGTLAGTNPPFITVDGSSLTEWFGNSPQIKVSGGFEICEPANGDVCQSGSEGTGLGQLTGRVTSLAVDSTGAIYTVDGRHAYGGGGRIAYRVEKFTPSGSDLIPSTFGDSEVQKISVNATGGTFQIGVPVPAAVSGAGQLSEGGLFISNYAIQKGTPEIGEPIQTNTRPGARITGVTPEKIEMSKSAFYSCFCQFTAAGNEYTSNLSATASAAEVKSALNNLEAIKYLGGSVSVSGGPGEYVVTFDGGVMKQTDQPQLVGKQGTTPLTGGTGPGADEALIATTIDGGPNGRTLGSTDSPDGNDAETPVSIAVGPNDEVFVMKNFPTGWGTCEGGLPAFEEMRLLEFDSAGHSLDSSKSCAAIPVTFGSDFENATAKVTVDETTGTPYVFSYSRPVLSEEGTCCVGGSVVYLFGDSGQKPTVNVDPASNISPTGATISGTINPNGPEDALGKKPAGTEYRIEYKKVSAAQWQIYAPDVSVGIGTSAIGFSVGISGLTPKVAYEARVVVTKPFGYEKVVKVTPPFTTLAAKPEIDAVSADHVAKDSVDLHALLNPLGTETTYHFEYGPTANYGSSTPDEPIGEGVDSQAVTQHVTGLIPVTYHFRVVATNELGTTVSTDTTFNFYPEQCPNSTVRQQTGSGSLPDCRAYELVSPEDAGSSSLGPGGPNTGEATAPSRFAFEGALGSIPGPWNPPNTIRDMYVATRSSTGWKTHFVGIPGEVDTATVGPPNGEGDETGGEGSTAVAGQIMATPSMNEFIGWSRAQQGFSCCGLFGSMAPYVFDYEGNVLGRWPTNVEEIQGGLKDIACWTNQPLHPCGPEGGFTGDEKVSADFSHYFFSSGNVAFAPEGQIHGIGSVYDDDIRTGEVQVASKLNNGEPIPKEPGVTNDDYMAIPAAAGDGSSVLMAASGTGICGRSACNPMPFPCESSCPPLPPSHLYMRVKDLVTYDVSQGHLVDYKGMSGDGTRVFFTSAEQLTTDDHDSSTDLYMWSRESDSITRVSAGSGSVGDSNACNASWIAKCGVQVVGPEIITFEPWTHDKGFSRDGDILFYSPEQFVGSQGIPGRRNLYDLHNGQIQYVATLEPNAPVTRVQMTTDGTWAAFITTSQLTTYHNNGFAEMYRYNADTGELTCVSCLPTGDPPASNVEGSQDGLFLTNDGRTFFTTEDAVVPQDTDRIPDVYEYVTGKAGLISTGIGQKARSPYGRVGLVGVSRDGTDVYFSTFETLVPEDHNGAFLKFYDARTNGGFPVRSIAAPCAAADECHGAGNSTMVAPTIGSAAGLGAGGNLSPTKHHKAKHHKKKHHRKKRKSTTRRER